MEIEESLNKIKDTRKLLEDKREQLIVKLKTGDYKKRSILVSRIQEIDILIGKFNANLDRITEHCKIIIETGKKSEEISAKKKKLENLKDEKSINTLNKLISDEEKCNRTIKRRYSLINSCIKKCVIEKSNPKRKIKGAKKEVTIQEKKNELRNKINEMEKSNLELKQFEKNAKAEIRKVKQERNSVIAEIGEENSDNDIERLKMLDIIIGKLEEYKQKAEKQFIAIEENNANLTKLKNDKNECKDEEEREDIEKKINKIQNSIKRRNSLINGCAKRITSINVKQTENGNKKINEEKQNKKSEAETVNIEKEDNENDESEKDIEDDTKTKIEDLRIPDLSAKGNTKLTDSESGIGDDEMLKLKEMFNVKTEQAKAGHEEKILKDTKFLDDMFGKEGEIEIGHKNIQVTYDPVENTYITYIGSTPLEPVRPLRRKDRQDIRDRIMKKYPRDIVDKIENCLDENIYNSLKRIEKQDEYIYQIADRKSNSNEKNIKIIYYKGMSIGNLIKHPITMIRTKILAKKSIKEGIGEASKKIYKYDDWGYYTVKEDGKQRRHEKFTKGLLVKTKPRDTVKHGEISERNNKQNTVQEID